MPLEGLEEEGLPKIPDLQLVQWKFLLMVENGLGIDKEQIWDKLLEAMTKDGKKLHTQKNFFSRFLNAAMAPFYTTVCAEVGRQLDPDLLSKMEAENEKELKRLEERIEDAQKNFGETEQRDALLAKAEYLCKIGNKVSLKKLGLKLIPLSCLLQEKAESVYRAAFEKTVGLSYRMDITFYLIRLGLFFMDHDLITRNIEKATR